MFLSFAHCFGEGGRGAAIFPRPGFIEGIFLRARGREGEMERVSEFGGL